MLAAAMERESIDPYDVVGVPPTASPAAIAAAYRAAAKRLHPDMPGTGDPEAFVRLQEAYRILSDPDRRAAFDQTRRGLHRPAWRMAETRLGFTRAMSWRRPRFLVPLLAIVTVIALTQSGALFLQPAPQRPAVAVTSDMAPAASVPRRAPAGTGAAIPAEFAEADHFIAPGPALAVPNGQIEAFTPVKLVRLDEGGARAEIRLASGLTATADAARLMPGDSRAARQAACLHLAGAPPRSGQMLLRGGDGPGALRVENRETQAAVVKLRDDAGRTVASVYIGSRGSADLTGLPAGSYRIAYAMGDVWSAPCGRFAAGMRAQALRAPLVIGVPTRISVPDAGAESIDDDDFVRD